MFRAGPDSDPPASGTGRCARKSQSAAKEAKEQAFAVELSCGAKVLPTAPGRTQTRKSMNGLIYLIGLIVVIMAILSLLGLR